MKKLFSLVVFTLFGAITYLLAIPAYPHPRTITQADGTIITIVQRGDENAHYTITEDGVLITQNENGIYEYAEISNLEIRATGVKALPLNQRSAMDLAFLGTLDTDLTQLSVAAAQKPQKSRQASSGSKVKQSVGVQRSLVILVNFSDKAFTISNPQQSFHNLLNQQGYSTNGATGSARDYYIAASDSAYRPTFDVYGPYTLPNNMRYYGGNTSSGDDSNPQQMIIDACNLANADVNFADYDTDGDGYVDNVFVYYAGTNEAEGGPSYTVWPHRWVVYPSVRLDGKQIYDYACTSELNGSSSMCGIGTFCHEFAHVLGLPDLYITDYGSSHTTLEEWSVMDYGGYLNSGRTPCTFSAYERFYLDWLTPTLLNEPASEQFGSLLSTNQAYMITQNGTHNMDGASPNPTQFFLLENRQRTGWDQYLPGHGMLITLINYSYSDWSNNRVNNTASRMGVDLIEADGSTLSSNKSGDPFPGTSNVTSYIPKLRNGTLLSNMDITSITESFGLISFNFMGGATTQLRTTGSLNTFVSNSGVTSLEQNVSLSGYGLVDSVFLNFVFGTHFQLQDMQNNWVFSTAYPANQGNIQEDIEIRYIPQNDGSHTDRLYITSTDAKTIYIDVYGRSGSTDQVDTMNSELITVIHKVNSWQVQSSTSESYQLRLSSIAGTLISEYTLQDNIELDRSTLSRGLYIIEIFNQQGERIGTFKLVN